MSKPPSESGSFSFSRFARQDFYTAVNRRLIQMTGLEPGMKVVDLACGTGAVTKLILERLQGVRESVVFAVDASTEAIEIAKRELAQVKSAVIEFVQGRAEQISHTLKEKVDAVVFCNAIHLVDDKSKVMREVLSILGPGGRFAFNSTFFADAQPPETERFYIRWMTRAIRILKRQHGLRPSREKVTARRQLSAEQYYELLSEHGFSVVQTEMEVVDVPLEGWLGISEFGDFIQGALPGVPLAQAAEALQEAVTQVFEELKLQAVPRRWLHVIAARPA
jgi:ubiquinone/menaquinone biosynthesis C-methylase UbiE